MTVAQDCWSERQSLTIALQLGSSASCQISKDMQHQAQRIVASLMFKAGYALCEVASYNNCKPMCATLSSLYCWAAPLSIASQHIYLPNSWCSPPEKERNILTALSAQSCHDGCMCNSQEFRKCGMMDLPGATKRVALLALETASSSSNACLSYKGCKEVTVLSAWSLI